MGGVMIYIFFSSVFITLFLVIGTLSLSKFMQRAQTLYSFVLRDFRPAFILALIAILCFIAACIFGHQIPDCYVP